MSKYDTETGSELFWAIRKGSDGRIGASFGNKMPNRFILCAYGNKDKSPPWTTAHKEDWDGLDEMLGGQISRDFDLVECPKGTELYPPLD